MPSDEKEKERLDILLTTYPEHGSRNVGDRLITDSALKLIRRRIPDYNPVMIFREEALERFDKRKVRSILAPGFSINDASYPKLFKLYENLDGVSKLFHPIGCSFQHLVPRKDTYNEYVYSDETLNFLRDVAAGTGPLPCRDQLIVDMLRKHHVPAFYCGDLALYDEGVIGSEFSPPEKIRSIAFTVQHKPKFIPQSFEILRLIKAEFPEAELYVVHHSQVNKNSQQVSDYAKSIGYSERDLSGEVSNLDLYNNVDLHIGYRLHGHISFLRRRKPSFLLIEDSRSFGIARTGCLDVGTFCAMDESGIEVCPNVPRQLIDYVGSQVEAGFSEYQQVFNFIDKSFKYVAKPYFDALPSRLTTG